MCVCERLKEIERERERERMVAYYKKHMHNCTSTCMYTSHIDVYMYMYTCMCSIFG